MNKKYPFILATLTLIAFGLRMSAALLTIQNGLKESIIHVWWMGHNKFGNKKKARIVEPNKRVTLVVNNQEIKAGPLSIATGNQIMQHQPKPKLKSWQLRTLEVALQNNLPSIRQLFPKTRKEKWTLLQKLK